MRYCKLHHTQCFSLGTFWKPMGAFLGCHIDWGHYWPLAGGSQGC